MKGGKMVRALAAAKLSIRPLKSISLPGGLWRGAVTFLLAAVAWEITARYIVANPLFLSSLSEIAERTATLWRDGDLQTHIWVSFVEFAWGYGAAAVVGIAAGIVLAEWRTLRQFSDPLISMLYAMPI